MKIAYVCPFYTPAIGGVKQVVEELGERYVKQGHEVHVFTSDWDKEKRIKETEEIINGVHVHRCRHVWRVANFMTFWPSLFPKLMKGKFDVIHSHLFAHPHFVMSAIAAKLKGIPHIHTTHCPWSDAPRSFLGKMGLIFSYNVVSRVALRFTDKILAITPWEIKFIKRFGGNEKQIQVMPNGMPEIFFKTIKKNDFKKKNEISGDLVLFFGRLSPTKRPDNFVEIAKLVLKERPKTKFVIRGPDEGLRELTKQKIGNEKRIKLMKETRDKEEIVKMYQAADMYVLPSYREGLPLTLFEAMASDLPIVASPVNGIPYEMKDPENGFLVKWDDFPGFAKKIIELLDNKKLREEIGKNNMKKAKNYTWEGIADRTMKIYKEAIRRKK
jgi:glycosyltransferase involved in cell wall biosynthesis